MKNESKNNKASKSVKQDRNYASKSIGMDSSLKLGMKAFSYSSGAEWSPMNPSLIWRKNKESDNATTIPSSFSNQRALMNSPGIIRQLENELGPVKDSIMLAATGEKLRDINIGNSATAKEVWKDEPLSQITKLSQQEREKQIIGFNYQEKLIYDDFGVKPAELVNMADFGNIKLPVRSVLSMSQEASKEVEKEILEKEGSLEMKLLNVVDPFNQKFHHNNMPENKMVCEMRPSNMTNLKGKILFEDEIDRDKEKNYQNDLMKLRAFNTNFEKHLGFKLTGKVCLDNIGDQIISLGTDNTSKQIGKEFRELRRYIGWEENAENSSKNDEKEFNMYGNLLDQKNISHEAIMDRLIENTTLYPCFDEVLFENTFRIHPDRNRNHVSLITDYLDATSVLNSSDLLLNIHKKQYTPPLAENFPKGLPSIVQDPRVIWQKEFLDIPYEVTADLIRKIQKGFWDEISNDIAKSSYGSISISSIESINNIRKFILNELNYNSIYNVDEPFDVSPPQLSPIERDQQTRIGTNSKFQQGNNKLVLTPRLKLGFGNTNLVSGSLSKIGAKIFGVSTSQVNSNSNENPKLEPVRNDVSTIKCIPDCELYESALWSRYEFPNDNSNKGIIRKVKNTEVNEGEPLYKEDVISMSNEWRTDMEKQTNERKKGVEMLVNSQENKSTLRNFTSNLNRIVESKIENMDKRELSRLSEIFKDTEKTETLGKTQLSGRVTLGEANKIQKDNKKLNISGIKNIGLSNIGINQQSTYNHMNSPDASKMGIQQNYILKKIKNSQKTVKNKVGMDSINDEYEDDESSIRDEDSEELEDLSSENEEDYRQICETIHIAPWEPTNLMMTKNLFKSMNNLFSTLSTLITKDSKFKNRVEIHELGEHGIVIWMARDPVGIKEKILACCSSIEVKLRVKGGIYFTPDTEISPIEPCTEIPGNYTFSVTGVSLSHLILNKSSLKQLDYVKKYVSNYENSLIYRSNYSNISNSNGNELLFQKTSNMGLGYKESNLRNNSNRSFVYDIPISEQTQFGVNADTDIDIITRYDKKNINNIDVMNLIPALNNCQISGQNTILVVSENPFIKGILPLTLSDVPKTTMKFSLRRNRLLLWRSIKCQIWKAQYIDYCFKSSLIPAKKVITFISNAFLKSNNSNSFDMGGLMFHETLFSHCINVALSRKDPKEMIFRGCYMGDEGFHAIFPLLTQVKSLGKLDLGMNNLTARSLPLILEVVKGCNCKKLLLDFNNLGPNKTKREFSVFFKHILFSTGIEHLNLSRNKINGRCIDSLDTILDNLSLKNKTLETLSWCSNGNTQPEIETLLLALQPCCLNLSKVFLGGNPIERIDAFRRRFSPIRIIMEDISSHYLNKSGVNQKEDDMHFSEYKKKKSRGISRRSITSNSDLSYANSGLFTQ
ncbi:leucine rich repeats [Cryptosporidium sp. chipmunk genotype I]|uniref:leucine rich repeats n=1 Tax=Cryptosporidium sp. chipmunk genotype I TaxID=1280935 RepID=UPI00351A049B|nr:leucine rich repeats [Cryptosporidium sp. chipmunk genotype I]